jgi:type VI secretion system protein ImpA
MRFWAHRQPTTAAAQTAALRFMALSTEFDLDQLVTPFSSGNPAGVDPRGDDSTGELRAIREARDEARRIERKADDNGEEPVESWQHWRTVRDISIRVLAEQSKDMEIAAYLVESLLRTDGFEGMAQGLNVIRGLVQNLWDDLYPLPDPQESDEETQIYERLRSITRLNGQDGPGLLPPVFARVPITEGATVGPFACWHYRQATELAKKTPEEQTRRINDGAVNMEKFDRAVYETSPQFFGNLVASLNACQVEIKGLDDALTEKVGRYSPSWTATREELEECTKIVRNVSKGRLPAEDVGVAAAGGAAAPAGGAVAGQSSPGALNNREDAFRMLELVAAFFERMDPQSLLAIQLRKTIRLGRMSPEEYYRELLDDDSAREKLFKLVGLKPQSDS